MSPENSTTTDLPKTPDESGWKLRLLLSMKFGNFSIDLPIVLKMEVGHSFIFMMLMNIWIPLYSMDVMYSMDVILQFISFDFCYQLMQLRKTPGTCRPHNVLFRKDRDSWMISVLARSVAPCLDQFLYNAPPSSFQNHNPCNAESLTRICLYQRHGHLNGRLGIS